MVCSKRTKVSSIITPSKCWLILSFFSSAQTQRCLLCNGGHAHIPDVNAEGGPLTTNGELSTLLLGSTIGLARTGLMGNGNEG